MKLWCKVCDQDHGGGMRKHCYRSLNEVKIDCLENENAKLREALEHIGGDEMFCDYCREDLERHYQSIACEALNDLRKGGE